MYHKSEPSDLELYTMAPKKVKNLLPAAKKPRKALGCKSVLRRAPLKRDVSIPLDPDPFRPKQDEVCKESYYYRVKWIQKTARMSGNQAEKAAPNTEESKCPPEAKKPRKVLASKSSRRAPSIDCTSGNHPEVASSNNQVDVTDDPAWFESDEDDDDRTIFIEASEEFEKDFNQTCDELEQILFKTNLVVNIGEKKNLEDAKKEARWTTRKFFEEHVPVRSWDAYVFLNRLTDVKLSEFMEKLGALNKEQKITFIVYAF